MIENALLVKMEKIPALPEPCMGIDAFASKEEYAFLCILLMFLEDRDTQEQFIPVPAYRVYCGEYAGRGCGLDTVYKPEAAGEGPPVRGGRRESSG